MINRSISKDNAYFLCLIDWENSTLDSKENQEFAEKVLGSDTKTIDDWIVKTLKLSNLDDVVSDIKLGFYHSRFVFQFSLLSAPNKLSGIREIRKKLENAIEVFFETTVIKEMKFYRPELKQPHIFVYPIFELDHKNPFWKSKFNKPFSMATTCFYTEIDDRSSSFRGRKVKTRISGAKIIATKMSDWFFYNLVNIIFHEGLYRQARDKQHNNAYSAKIICHGLENRLENFASQLMTTFHTYSSEYVRRNIQRIAIGASVFAILISIGSLIIAILNLIKWHL